MGFFSDFTGSSARKDIRQGFKGASSVLDQGEQKARGEINAGYDGATGFADRTRGELGSGYRNALGELQGGYTAATGALEPYSAAGTQANAFYADALGLNGVERQQAFGGNYAASDPFRAQNADMATEAAMKALNARGLSGSGYAAEAIARQNLARGSEDYQNYLTRLQGMQAQGQNLAGQRANLATGYYGDRAGLASGYGRDVANTYAGQGQNSINRGNALSDLSYGNAQQRANLITGKANAVAGTRGTTWNNLSGLAGMAIKAYTAGQGG